MLRCYLPTLIGGLVGLVGGVLVVWVSGCGEVAAACWGGGSTNVGLVIGGLVGLRMLDNEIKKVKV